jgi:hypothetical protein
MKREEAQAEKTVKQDTPIDPLEEIRRKAALMYPTYSWDDIEGYVHNPADDLVGTKGLGLISKGGSFMLIGPTGHGKSILMQQWAVSMAAGIKILGRIEVHKPLKILYYQSDNQLSDMHIDLTSIREHLGVSKDTLRKNLVMKRIFSVSGLELHTILEADVIKHKPDILIMDNYQSFIDGDINSTEVFQEWRMAVEPIMSKYKMAVIIVAHTTKKTQYDNKNVINPSDSVYLASGTAALANWVRTSAWLSIDNDAPVGCYKLVLGKNWQRAGLGMDKSDNPIRDLKIEHSRNFLKPHWTLSEQQVGIRVNNATFDRVVKMYKEHPEMKPAELGKSLFPPIERSVVAKYLIKAEKEGLIPKRGVRIKLKKK